MLVTQWRESLLTSKVTRCYGADKKACVAIILRRRNGSEEMEDLEMFFILRAINKQDRWSGQVGLPGGRQEKGETDEATAAREVYEEVGLALPGLDKSLDGGESSFERIGRVHDREVLQGKHKLVVSAFVYLQVSSDTPDLKLLPKEVRACGWCSISQLLDRNCGLNMDFHLHNSFVAQENPALIWIACQLGLGTVSFTQVPLNISPLFYCGADSDFTVSIDLDSKIPEERDVRDAFFLWGMTLSIVNDLFYEMTKARENRIVNRSSYCGFEIETVFGHPIHNLLLQAMRSIYEKLTGQVMPWSMYIKAYPGIVAATVFSTSTAIVTSFLRSRL